MNERHDDAADIADYHRNDERLSEYGRSSMQVQNMERWLSEALLGSRATKTPSPRLVVIIVDSEWMP